MREPSAIAVRTLDLARPLKALMDVKEYASTRIFITLNDELIGRIDIPNCYQPISASRLHDAVADKFAGKLFKAMLAGYYAFGDEPSEAETLKLPANVPASVVVATYDRPDDLRKCVECLVAQVTPRRFEIIVVDNHPASGVTPAALADFPGVTLITETRKGLSYARNRGIAHSTGDIIVSTDDDVTMPPDWLEKLIAPFSHSEIMIVTGNILPLELETRSQCLFEAYGGLGRGFEARTVDRNWFDQFRTAVQTWQLGATANAAFRATIFSHPEIGLMDESLGAGTPTGCSEDTYLFYKTLKAGYAITYEPASYVWHKHRRDERALRHQIYSYSKGHVAYQLITLLRDHDRRALLRLLVGLPQTYISRSKDRIFGKSDYPLSLILLEILGNLAGPWALWQSRRRVRSVGRSEPYIEPSLRSIPSTYPSETGPDSGAVEESRKAKVSLE
jgi:O-antigen biosynthesis protein